jgi:hypothetical protein
VQKEHDFSCVDFHNAQILNNYHTKFYPDWIKKSGKYGYKLVYTPIFTKPIIIQHVFVGRLSNQVLLTLWKLYEIRENVTYYFSYVFNCTDFH